LAVSEYHDALRFCLAHGADGVMAGARLDETCRHLAAGGRHQATAASMGEVWVKERPRSRGRQADGWIDSLVWAGGNLIPVAVGSDCAPEYGALARRRGRRYLSIVGGAAAVAGMWRVLEPGSPRPRAYRPCQPLLVIDTAAFTNPDPEVKVAGPDQLETILPACWDMFTEELGFPPPGPQDAYKAHVASQLKAGCILARLDPASGQVIFKAELGAAAGDWVQVQGVWTDPRWRGQGYAKAGMAAILAEAGRRGYRHVCLYVNDFNAAALNVYQAVGFTQASTWATVMF
jgi:GNAT superfamily N-acetyltransferase